jgi:hypothetical protein
MTQQQSGRQKRLKDLKIRGLESSFSLKSAKNH